LDAVPKLEWAVNELLSNGDRRIRLGKIGRAWVEATHNRSNFLEAWSAILMHARVGSG
jgi:hypothetical protein